jgi:hypothetical protein
MALKRNPITGIPPRPDKEQSEPQRRPESTRDEYDTAISSPDDAYDTVIASAKEFTSLEPGRYEAILNEITALPMKETGGFIRAEFIIADPDEKLMGRRHSVLFQMVQDDGRTPGEWGPVFYHRMMAKLGYPKDNRGKEAREELTSEKPGVYLKITAGKQDGFVNTSVEGRFERDNDNIETLREWMGNNPF